jgi:hypothetical protein
MRDFFSWTNWALGISSLNEGDLSECVLPTLTPIFIIDSETEEYYYKNISLQHLFFKMDPSEVKVPPLKDLTTENITENVVRINGLCDDARLKYVMQRLVHHLHDFARETRLSSNEWMAGLNFLKDVGQISSDVRQVRMFSNPWI